MNETQLADHHPQASGCSGCTGELGFLGAGLVLPCASLTFYRLAARRRLASAILFFFLFSLVITGLSTVDVGVAMFSTDARQGFDESGFPEITIEDGVASVDAEQPLVLLDEDGRTFVIDTTGEVERLDASRHYQGVLLTRTTLHVLNRGEYQEIPLDALQEGLAINPIVINADSVARFWIVFSAVTTVVAFLFLIVWNMLIRFIYVVMLGLVIWGVAALIRPGTGFGPVLVTGVYAMIPAMYVHYLLGLVNFGFPGLQTVVLLPVWAVALVVALAEPDGGLIRGERPLRGWRALIGVPMLLVFALGVVFSWSGLVIASWLVALFTFLVLLAVGLWTARRQEQDKAVQPMDYETGGEL